MGTEGGNIDVMQQPVVNTTGGVETSDPSAKSKAMFVILVGLVAHAFTAPWVKQANFEPATSAFLRVAIALFVLLPFARNEKKRHGGLNKSGVWLSLLAGLFLGIDFMAFNYSIFFVGSGIAMVLLNMQIIILPALAAIFDGYQIKRSYYVLLPIFLLGIILTGGVLEGASATTEGAKTFFGFDLALLGTIAGALSGSCYGVYLYASRKATVVNPGRFIQPMTWAFLAQLVAPIIFMMFSGRGFDLGFGVLANGVLPLNPETTVGSPITPMNWVWMIVLGTAGQALTWTSIQWGSVRLDPTIVAGLLLLSTVATVAFIAPVMFREIPTTMQIVGTLVVLGAVAYQNNLHKALLRRPKLTKSC